MARCWTTATRPSGSVSLQRAGLDAPSRWVGRWMAPDQWWPKCARIVGFPGFQEATTLSSYAISFTGLTLLHLK